MGFENLIEYRDLFPVTRTLIYLNHAAVAPLSTRAAAAIAALAADVLENGSLHYDRWNADLRPGAYRRRAAGQRRSGRNRAHEKHLGRNRDHRDGARLAPRRPHRRI